MANKNTSKRPLTIPTSLETDEAGVERLTFVYTQKGVSYNYTVRIDFENVLPGMLTPDFKMINSVYPKAVCGRHEYRGNRWDYESTVNELGWKLCFLNEILVGKRGLLQRAVDSYRNTKSESKSRRAARVEKHGEDYVEDLSTLQTKPLGKRVRKKSAKAVDYDELEDDDYLETAAASGSGLVRTNSPFENSSPELKRTYSQSGLANPRPKRERTVSSVSGTGSALARSSSTGALPLHHHHHHHHHRSESPLHLGRDERRSINSPRPDAPPRLVVETVKNSAPYQIRLRMDLDSIPKLVDKVFCQQNQPYPRPKTPRESACNAIAWKLAYLNPQVLVGNLELLQRSVDVWMEKQGQVEDSPRAGLKMMAQTFAAVAGAGAESSTPPGPP